MSRRPRLHVPGALYHVILRGNNRQEIFFSAADRVYLDELVARASGELGASIHAYCWMPNHVHMAVRIGDRPLGRLMQWVASRYAFHVNRRREATGHLFERRYRAILVDSDAYALQLVRYIHRNPVKAGLVSTPAEYPWSSHRQYLNCSRRNWVETDWIFRLFGHRRRSALAEYRRFVEDGAGDDDFPEELEQGSPDDERLTGADRLLAEVRVPEPPPEQQTTLDELVIGVARRHGVDPAVLSGPSRQRCLAGIRREIAREAVMRGIASPTQVARRLNRSDTAICRLLRD